MKNFKKPHTIAGQSNGNVQKSQKHDANLQKNSTLYFQIGLILCLLGTYAILEMKFEDKVFVMEDLGELYDNSEIDVKNYVVEPDVIIKKQVQRQSQRLVDKPPVIVDNDTKIVETDLIIPEPAVLNTPLAVNTFDNLEKPEIEIEKPFNMTNVEVVPIYPGCEDATTNKERLKCMSDKLGRLVQRKFNTGLARDLGLSGIQKIDVQFKIDKTGHIIEIKSRAPFKLLEEEAARVVSKIPQMTPGTQRQEPVSVLYNLPIKFNVKN